MMAVMVVVVVIVEEPILYGTSTCIEHRPCGLKISNLIAASAAAATTSIIDP